MKKEKWVTHRKKCVKKIHRKKFLACVCDLIEIVVATGKKIKWTKN